MRKLLGWADKEELLSWPKKELGILSGGMEGKAWCELCESARYVRAAIPVSHGNRKLFVHVASLCNENTGHKEVIKNMRNERTLERAFTDAAALGDQAVFLCADASCLVILL